MVMPFGVGSIIAGVLMPSKQLMRRGCYQLLLTLVIIGAVWSFLFGIVMVCSGVLGEVETTPETQQVGAPVSAIP